MTDETTQQTQWQQQWQTQQQWYTDDVLGWENIFPTIPDISQEDNKEDKYQFEPIPETIEELDPSGIPPQPKPEIQQQPSVQQVVAPVVQQPIPQPRVQQTTTPVVQQPVQPVRVQAVPSVVQQPQIPKVEPVVVQTPTPPVSKQEIPIPQEAIEEVAIDEVEPEEVEENTPVEEIETLIIEESKFQTDVQKKFGELFSTTKKIYELKNKIWITDDTFDILWANNDKVFISYRFLLDETSDPMLFITKIEEDKDTEEETNNELRFTFNEETQSLEVVVNEVLLFDEVEDFSEDQKKKLQVIDKINKFTFLASEELRKIEKEIKQKEEEERERRKLQEIFRNF